MRPAWLLIMHATNLAVWRNTWKLTIEKSLTNVPGVTSHVTRLAEGKAQWLNIWKSMDSSKNASAGCKDIIQQKPSPSQSQEDHKKNGPKSTRCSTWWGNWEWVSATGTIASSLWAWWGCPMTLSWRIPRKTSTTFARFVRILFFSFLEYASKHSSWLGSRGGQVLQRTSTDDWVHLSQVKFRYFCFKIDRCYLCFTITLQHLLHRPGVYILPFISIFILIKKCHF